MNHLAFQHVSGYVGPSGAVTGLLGHTGQVGHEQATNSDETGQGNMARSGYGQGKAGHVPNHKDLNTVS